MCDKSDDPKVVTTIIYTTEAKASAQKAEEEKKVDDPTPERAVALLKGEQVQEPTKEAPPHESQAS